MAASKSLPHRPRQRAEKADQVELTDPPTDIISAVKFAPQGLRLLVSSWDRNVYLYEIAEGSSTLIQKYEHRAPVLDVCWGEGEDDAYSAGLDWDVRRINLKTGEKTLLSSHSAGVKSLAYSRPHNLLISASWDSTLHLHHTQPPATSPASAPSYTALSLPQKPFSLSLSPSKLIVAMSSRALHIYDLPSLSLLASQSSSSSSPTSKPISPEPYQRRESPLKFQTRALASMPNDLGYASSSIEGRVAVEWFDPSPEVQGRKYAFKCHRQPAPAPEVPGGGGGGGGGADIVYPVNALAFHPVHGTFASGGGDGFVSLWDGATKRRIRQYQRYPAAVVGLGFSGDGRWLAVAVSPGFEDGEGEGEVVRLGKGGPGVWVRELGENEAKGKGGK